jgi:ribosomal protein S18 acetylase RimI-like enzyme
VTAGPPPLGVRSAEAADLEAVGRLLDAFNREFDEASPGAAWIAERLGELLAGGDTAVLVGGDGPGSEAAAVLRFRPGLWSRALECYLAELYVVPSSRGRGLGRALLEASMAVARERGADRIELGTSEDDIVARALYESLGFTNREGAADGPIMYVYEREL